jgi:hypothetical protein
MDYSSVNSMPPPSGFAKRDMPQMQSRNDLPAVGLQEQPPLHDLPAQGATGGGGGKAVQQKPQEDIKLEFEDMRGAKKDISNYNRISDFVYIFIAVLVVDVVIIVLTRYFPDIFGTNLNRWYDLFGLNAVIADVLIIVIGFVIGRYVYTSYVKEKFVDGEWSPVWFTGTLIVVQLIHDLMFYFGVVKQLPPGMNSMIDLLKKYGESGGAKILLGDAAMMTASSFLAMTLKASAGHIVSTIGLVALYVLPYILYTKPGLSTT